MLQEKFFTHNEALDFYLAAGALSRGSVLTLLRALLEKDRRGIATP